MKHHKAKGVWAHKPDALPLPDAPSMGPKRKKGPLARLSKKHLWDLLAQNKKEMLHQVDRLFIRGIPKAQESGSGWVSADCWFAELYCDGIIQNADAMEGLIKELEGRMDG